MANSIQITVRGGFPKFDPNKYMTAYTVHLKALFEGAAAAFVRRVVVADAIHLDTGMSRSSLLPLARAINAATATVVESSIIGARSPRKGLTLRDGRSYAKDRFKGPREGEEAGERAFDLVLGNPKNPVFTFRFRINVFQWRHHEERWNAIGKGEAAFKEHIRAGHQAPPLTAGFLSGRKI